ncbi:MAG: hypothetical protein AAGF88_04075 [Pseudomonadota bacterium]
MIGTTFRRIKFDLLTAAIVLASVMIVADVIGAAHAPIDMLAQIGYDSSMRLVAVREWMAGASWFDTTIDRVMPPDGLSLHWSRYFDLGIAGMIGVFSLFASEEFAEGAAIVLWPTLLLVIFLWATARAAYRMFGRDGAAISVLGVALWETLNGSRFGPFSLDHHGFQVLLMLGAILVLIHPARAKAAAVLAGILCALSLAVGLEMLPAIGLVGIVFMWRGLVSPGESAAQLAAFGLALPIASLGFFLGQTPQMEWAAARCDELAAPFLVLVGSSGGAALAAAIAAPFIAEIRWRLILGSGLAVVAVAISLPWLEPCLSGPYGNLPEHLRDVITTIPEARSMLSYLNPEAGLGTFFRFVLPTFATVAFATFLLLRHQSNDHVAPEVRTAVAVLLGFAWLGIAASFHQYRMMALAEPVIPLLMAYVGAVLIGAWRANPTSRGISLAMIFGLAVMLIPGQIYKQAFRTFDLGTDAEQTADGRYVAFNHCRHQADVVRTLNDLPPSNLMLMGNLGRPTLILTHHRIINSPYHRSEMAMQTLLLTWETDIDVFRQMLVETSADYLVVCRNGFYGLSEAAIGTRLASGEIIEGFRLLNVADDQLMVFALDSV